MGGQRSRLHALAMRENCVRLLRNSRCSREAASAQARNSQLARPPLRRRSDGQVYLLFLSFVSRIVMHLSEPTSQVLSLSSLHLLLLLLLPLFHHKYLYSSSSSASSVQNLTLSTSQFTSATPIAAKLERNLSFPQRTQLAEREFKRRCWSC